MPGRSYLGLVGNGETLALIDPQARLAWLCIPRCDGVPIFCGALDHEQGGSLALELVRPDGGIIPLAPAGQAYQGRTALLTTTLTGHGVTIQVTDWMPRGGRGLVRRLEVQGAPGTRLRATLRPVTAALWPAITSARGSGVAVTTPGAALYLTAAEAGAPAGTALEVPLCGRAGDGDGRRTVTLYLGYGEDESRAQAAAAELAAATPEAEAAWWDGWLSTAHPLPGPVSPRWEEAYWRSLVVLKLLIYESTGAPLAAATASFPDQPGGETNWDYRYVWLRDGYLTATTLDAAGLHREARRFYDFAFRIQDPDGHWSQPLYTVDGGEPVEVIATDLRGPGGERPIRFGNAASGQLQLDNEANVLHGLWFHYRLTGDQAALSEHWDGVCRAAGWVEANWRRMESGLWELREYVAHWVYGKALCAAGLIAAARIARVLGENARAAGWERTAETIRAEVLARGWDPERQAYLRHYGEGTPPAPLDISVLALAFYGLLPAEDARMVRTVAAMERPARERGLWQHGGYCRWEGAAMPFYLPTLWLARYWLMVGRTGDCDRLIEACLDAASDLLLMGEHFDGRDGRQWGNFPQAFSHLELARLIRERVQGWPFRERAWPEGKAAGH